MWVRYDREADAAYVYVRDRLTRPGEATRTTSAYVPDEEACIMLDFDTDNRLIGFEILSASRILDPEILAAAVPTASLPPVESDEE